MPTTGPRLIAQLGQIGFAVALARWHYDTKCRANYIDSRDEYVAARDAFVFAERAYHMALSSYEAYLAGLAEGVELEISCPFCGFEAVSRRPS